MGIQSQGYSEEPSPSLLGDGELPRAHSKHPYPNSWLELMEDFSSLLLPCPPIPSHATTMVPIFQVSEVFVLKQANQFGTTTSMMCVTCLKNMAKILRPS